MKLTLIVEIQVRDEHIREDSEEIINRIEEIRTNDYEVRYADYQNGLPS